MKTVFDASTRDELISRISSLNESSRAQWGKMTIYQMLKHNTLWEEWVSGKKKNKQMFIGRLFGRKALKNILKEGRVLSRNTPTLPDLRTDKLPEKGDIALEKAKWIAQIEGYAHYSNPEFVHVFFGKMTKEEIGYLAYKHADHHLRQFNA